MTSLLFNVVVSFFEGQHPFHIIQVYLTVGLGDTALAEFIKLDVRNNFV